jgi:hypothetical protein
MCARALLEMPSEMDTAALVIWAIAIVIVGAIAWRVFERS